jgi:C4-dicarboxylate-specific signal transduction histidine kinase
VNAITVEEAGAPGKFALIGPLDKLLPHTDQTFVQWLVAFARGDRFFRSEAHITMPDGSVLDTLFAAALPKDFDGFANIIVTSLDVTAYKREQVRLRTADAEIARASRISTVGALSASIAHEVNSPLAAVLANAQAALRCLQRPSPNLAIATEAVAAVVTEATRAKDVVARTRDFVGNGAAPFAPFDIVIAAREASLLVEQELRRLDIALHLRAGSQLPLVDGDLVQIKQVFANLLLNAAQAMAGQPGKKEVTVSIRLEGDRIRVDVADTGPGIKMQDLERVFDSFYTTKKGGMGMGLAICRNSIDAQGGSIWATSDTNGGAVVHFYLRAHHA